MSVKPKLEIYLFGHSRVLYNGKDITKKLSTKSEGLLYYIAVNEHINRERLAYMFWEESDSESAKYNLRYNLWSMNKVFRTKDFDAPLIVSEPNRVFFSEAYEVYVDINDFVSLDKKDDVLSLYLMKKLYTGGFLDGFYIKNCFKFNDWTFYERENYQRQFMNVLHKLLGNHKKCDEYDKACLILEEMIRLNNLDEDLYVELIKLYIDQGDRVLALKQYNRCIHVLREELNISPKLSTEKLLKIIKTVKCTTVKKDAKKLVLVESLEACSLEGVIIRAKAIPVDINYYYLTLLLEALLPLLKEGETDDFEELARVHTAFKSKKLNPLSTECEKNIIFQSVYNLFNSFECDVNIVIERLHYLDTYSFECLKYMLFRGINRGTVYFTCTKDSTRYIELNQYFEF